MIQGCSQASRVMKIQSFAGLISRQVYRFFFSRAGCRVWCLEFRAASSQNWVLSGKHLSSGVFSRSPRKTDGSRR